MVNEPDWKLEQDDFSIAWTGSMNGDQTLTNLILVYIDAEDGVERTIEAPVLSEIERLGLHERLVRARQPMTTTEAATLADKAATVLGGLPPWRATGTLWADRMIAHRSGERRPATKIKVGDTLTVTPTSQPGPLTVFAADVTGDGRVVEIIASDHDLGERIEIEKRLEF